MLKTLFGDLGAWQASGPPYGETEPVFAATALLDEVVPAALPRQNDPNVVDVFVTGSPAHSMREHFTTSRADLGSATSMITLLDPSRVWAPSVVKALSDATGQPVEKLHLRERATLRTLAVIERTAVPRRATGPLKVYHANVRVSGLEHDEIVNALAERSHMTVVIVGALQQHAVDALLRSLLMATQQPDWHCPWLVFLLPPGAAMLRHRVLSQPWPAGVRTTALAETLSGASTVWNTILSAWEACSSAPTLAPTATARRIDDSLLTKALFALVRTEGVIACGVVDLTTGELLAHDSRGSLNFDLAARARRLTAARRVFGNSAEAGAEGEELMVTTTGRIDLLRAAPSAPGRLGMVLVLDRRLANLQLARFKLMQAEKNLP